MMSGSSAPRHNAPKMGGVGGLLSAINIPLLLVLVALLAIGLVTLYPVTLTDPDYSIFKQMVSIGAGLVGWRGAFGGGAGGRGAG